MKKIQEWLKENGFNLNVNFSYNVTSGKVIMDLPEILSAVAGKFGEASVIKVLDKIKEKYQPGKWFLEGLDSQKEMRKHVEEFLYESAMYKAFENERDFTWSDITSDTEFSQEFLEWWQEEKGLTEQQMLCDHDESDTYSIDGHFYNSVGVCKKCNIDMNDDWNTSEEIEVVYKAWSRTK